MFRTFLVGAILPTLSCQALELEWYGNNMWASAFDGITSNKQTEIGENYRIKNVELLSCTVYLLNKRVW